MAFFPVVFANCRSARRWRAFPVVLLALLLSVVTGMSTVEAAESGPASVRYVASIQPLVAILAEVTVGRAAVDRLLAPGVSPHTFEPTPSDMKKLASAGALFFVGPSLDGEWIGRMPVRRKVGMLGLVPAGFLLPMGEGDSHHHGDHGAQHEEGGVDPHFWTDPLAVKAMLPALVRVLRSLDPEGGTVYAENALAFAARLDRLHGELQQLLVPIRHEPVLLFHPSFNYLFHRYGLLQVGVVEESPGREPTPGSLLALVKKIRRLRVKALFTEPQLARRPAEVLAEAAAISVHELDPLGGSPGRASYAEILRYNALSLARALR